MSLIPFIGISMTVHLVLIAVKKGREAYATFKRGRVKKVALA